MPATSVHFNGSVNLPDAETVMREISSRIPVGVRRITEGETGDRNYWVLFQFRRFAAMPEFDEVPTVEGGPEYASMPMVRLADGVEPNSVQWPEVGYAAAYERSFEVFRALQQQGVIARDVRMQLQFPTPVATLSTVVPQDAQRLAPAYAAALFADLQQSLNRLPHDKIAVQWDIAIEIGVLTGGFPVEPQPFETVVASIVQCLDQVPDDVPVGVHLCYGDFMHTHFVQPDSLELQVRLLNALTETARRPIGFAAFTVPQGRSDEQYFAPLQQLRVPATTEINFGLVPYHPGKQAPGTTAEQVRQIDAAIALIGDRRDWGVCTECGMGRVDEADVPHLLDLHREIVAGNY